MILIVNLMIGFAYMYIHSSLADCPPVWQTVYNNMLIGGEGCGRLYGVVCGLVAS